MTRETMKKISSLTLRAVLGLVIGLAAAGVVSFAGETERMGEGEVTLYKDAFDQSAYGEAMNQLDLGRWGRKITGKTIPSASTNIFDEVPDSPFFTNRHARQKLSAADLEKGAFVADGPDLSKPLSVQGAEQQGAHYGFLVEDVKKDKYILRFDAQGASELNTAAEVIGNRFYYALGYNVPQATILSFAADQLMAAPDAITIDNTGFVKKLTQKILQEYLLFVPLPNGVYRASATKVPAGTEAGKFSFLGRGKNNPQDIVNHRDLREIRALGVFAAWLNHHEMLESNTLDMAVTENGRTVLKHYLTDFTNSLGAATDGPKEPMFGYEHMVDYGESIKAILGLGFWEKPWQKKWRLAGEKIYSPAVGYFSNDLFDPAKFKDLLPYEAFRVITRADGFWAAKIMMSFSDEDIRAMVKAGKYSRPDDEDYIVKTLSERRDMIAKYWFSRVSPLDQFAFLGGVLSFKDLAVVYGFVPREGTVYRVEVSAGNKKIADLETAGSEVKLQPKWLSENSVIQLSIRALRSSSQKENPPVTVRLNAAGVQGIRHAD